MVTTTGTRPTGSTDPTGSAGAVGSAADGATPRNGGSGPHRRSPGVATAGEGWLGLSAPLAILTAVAAGSGILVDATYRRDTVEFGTQGRAQDWITLLVAVPALVALWRLAVGGSLRARLLWHGVVLYLAYTYVIAAFMVRFNHLFLVYTTLVGCSVLALVGSLSGMIPTFPPGSFDPARWPRRGVVALLGVVVAGFAGLWLADVVPALLEGGEPASLAEAGTPTNGVQVLDLSLLLPGATLVALATGRGERWGLALATGLLAFVALLGLALVAMVIGLAVAGLADGVAPAALFALLVAVTVWLLARAMTATAPGGRW